MVNMTLCKVDITCVLDMQTLEVTIWTPEGTLIRRVGGRGDGPGESSDPGPLFLFDDRFQVGDHARYTTFTLDGEVVRTDGFPPGVGLLEEGMDMATARRSFTRFQDFAMFADGSVGALGLPPWVLDGDVPEEEDPAIPVLRASQDAGAWGIDTLGLLSFRDVYATLDHPEFGEINLDEVPGMWYAVRKGVDDSPIRSVVLPERFRPMDVNATHVWGIRRDELDVQYVVGLRLERAGG